jgi:hypothetical protein
LYGVGLVKTVCGLVVGEGKGTWRADGLACQLAGKSRSSILDAAAQAASQDSPKADSAPIRTAAIQTVRMHEILQVQIETENPQKKPKSGKRKENTPSESYRIPTGTCTIFTEAQESSLWRRWTRGLCSLEVSLAPNGCE